MDFINGVKNIQTAGYNGARTVYGIDKSETLLREIHAIIVKKNWQDDKKKE